MTINYHDEMYEEAASSDLGLFTVDVISLNGVRTTIQGFLHNDRAGHELVQMGVRLTTPSHVLPEKS